MGKINAASAIENAAAGAVRVIASAAAEAAKVVANSAADAAKVAVTRGAEDHDLLLELKVKMADIKVSVDTLIAKEDSHVTRVEFIDHLKTDVDHETRIRLIEQNMWKWLGIGSLGGLAGGVISIVMAFALKFIH
jgi:hypothetical protein